MFHGGIFFHEDKFLEEFSVHRKIEWNLQTFLLYYQAPTGIALPLSMPPQRSGASVTLMNLH